jgi:branched-subunit amino acid transport protein AzlD
MMLNPWQAVLVIAVVAVCTFLTRFFPFALFGGSKEVPHSVKYLGSILPPSVIAILVVTA